MAARVAIDPFEQCRIRSRDSLVDSDEHSGRPSAAVGDQVTQQRVVGMKRLARETHWVLVADIEFLIDPEQHD
jgi:hypothetical protein